MFNHEQTRSTGNSVWNVGDKIIGIYEVNEIYTSGGMGLVYKIYHPSWNIDLAMKSPRTEFFSHPSSIESFVRECNNWVDLGLHPNIVTCYYVREIAGIPRIFMEFMNGGNLYEHIRSGEFYSAEYDKTLTHILDIAIQTARGLSYAHKRGLVHRTLILTRSYLTPFGEQTSWA